MSGTGRLAPEVLRNRYVRAHQALQAAIAGNVKLQARIDLLEAENKILKEERDAR